MSNAPLMPKATAVWLVDNTALTFDQVADFTKMHPLEVQAIADGDAAQGIKGMDPISTGQLTREEIEKGEEDPNYRLKLGESKVIAAAGRQEEGPALYPGVAPPGAAERDPVAGAQPSRVEGRADHAPRRHHQDHDRQRPRPHPLECLDLTPMDPVTLGLCSQIELDFEVQRAAKEKPVPAAYGGATLLPASETTKKEPEFEPTEKQRDDLNVDAVFAKLKKIGGKKAEEE